MNFVLTNINLHFGCDACYDTTGGPIFEPMFRTLTIVLIAITCTVVIGCADKVPPTSDAFNAHNVFGGASRSNDYSTGNAPPVADVRIIILDSNSKSGIFSQPLPLTSDRTAMLLQDGSLLIVINDSINHRFQFPANEHPMPALAADALGNCYAVTTRGTLYCFDSTARQKWMVHTIDTNDAAPVLAYSYPLCLDSCVIVGSSRGLIARYDQNGSMRWKSQMGAGITTVFSASRSSGIVIGITHDDYAVSDTVRALNPETGERTWMMPLPMNRIHTGPVISESNILVGTVRRDSTGNRYPSITALSLSGKTLWTKPSPVFTRGISADHAGNWYVTGTAARTDFGGGAIVSFTSEGKQRWEVDLESSIPAAAAVSADWVYFVSRKQNRAGIYTYTHEGVFQSFVSIDVMPEIAPEIVITSAGIVLSAMTRPMMLVGGK